MKTYERMEQNKKTYRIEDKRMPLGWIDFSKSERNKVLSVFDLLSEAGTLYELGIAPIRDGYANIFSQGLQRSRREQSIS